MCLFLCEQDNTVVPAPKGQSYRVSDYDFPSASKENQRVTSGMDLLPLQFLTALSLFIGSVNCCPLTNTADLRELLSDARAFRQPSCDMGTVIPKVPGSLVVVISVPQGLRMPKPF